MVFNATFNNISAISWGSVLLVEEIRIAGENHRPAASHLRTWSHNVALSTPRVAVSTDSTSSYNLYCYQIVLYSSVFERIFYAYNCFHLKIRYLCWQTISHGIVYLIMHKLWLSIYLTNAIQTFLTNETAQFLSLAVWNILVSTRGWDKNFTLLFP